MYQACVENDVVITFCHQRRFGGQFIKAKELANDGTIGQLRRVEGSCANMFDWGTHWFDMFFFYNNEVPAEWLIGQIDVAEESSAFGVQVETSGVAWIGYENGVQGLLVTGATGLTGGEGPRNRLVGTDGIIEVGGRELPPLRVLAKGYDAWRVPDLDKGVASGEETVASVLDLVDCLENGREPELSARKALRATELIFATYESSRRRAKIELPLEGDDSALLTMLETGTIGPER